jgi:hypothetical protein
VSSLTLISLLSLVLVGINPTAIVAQNLTNNATGDGTDLGGLSAESVNMTK